MCSVSSQKLHPFPATCVGRAAPGTSTLFGQCAHVQWWPLVGSGVLSPGCATSPCLKLCVVLSVSLRSRIRAFPPQLELALRNEEARHPLGPQRRPARRHTGRIVSLPPSSSHNPRYCFFFARESGDTGDENLPSPARFRTGFCLGTRSQGLVVVGWAFLASERPTAGIGGWLVSNLPWTASAWSAFSYPPSLGRTGGT